MTKTNALFKGVTFAIALVALAMCALFAMTPQKAFASDDQLTLTVPTSFPTVLLGDGTIVEPDWTVTNPTDKDASISAISVNYEYLNSNNISAQLQFGENGNVEKTIDLAVGGTKASAQVSKKVEANKSKPFTIDIVPDTSTNNVYKLYSDSTLSTVLLCKLSLTYTLPLDGTLTIAGNKTTGSVITSTLSDFPADGVAKYQWYRDGVAISGATSTTYTVVSDDIGKMITCKVVDTSGNYSGEVVSNEVGKIQAVVEFKDWDGTVLKTENVEAGTAATAPSNPSRTGYTFTGWSPSDLSKITADITVTATYKINSYTVKFETNGGDAIASQTVEYGKTAAQPSSTPTYEGHTFLGYYSDSACTKAYVWTTAIQENTTIYLNWQRPYYRLRNPYEDGGYTDYHWTCSQSEINNLVSEGWILEDKQFTVSVASAIPVGRAYSRTYMGGNGSHYWSTDTTTLPAGSYWNWENLYDFGSCEKTTKDYPIHQMVKNGHYAYVRETEVSAFIGIGFSDQGIAFYAYSY